MLSVTYDACQSVISLDERNAVDIGFRHRHYHLCPGCAVPIVTALHLLGLPREFAVIR